MLIARLIRWGRNTEERPFGYLRLAGVFSALMLVPLCVAYTISSNPKELHAEGSAIEVLSLSFWCASLVACIVGLFRWRYRLDRLVFKWFSLLCGLAAIREADAHVLLNPKYLGQFGVHYRIDWFLSSKFHAGVLLKLMWFTIFLTLLTFLIAPMFVLRKPIRRLIQNGDAATGLFLLGIIGLFIGFVCDDILRHTHFISLNLRQMVEETSEMLAAAFFLMGVCFLLWKPASQRTGQQVP